MPATMLAFCDLPDRIRMAARATIDAAGGDVARYFGPYVQVAIPNPSGPFFAAMEAAGLELDDNSLHYFPLGSDAPPEHLRHFGPINASGQPGYWLYGNFSPRP
jgi:hypothetical protein